MTLSSALSLVFKTIPRSSVVETFGVVWGFGWIMGWEGVSDEMEGVTNGKVCEVVGQVIHVDDK